MSLTTGVDTFPGTSGADTFIGDDTGANATVGVADSISGGAGVDTFKHYLVSTATAVVNPTMTSIENLYINGGGAVTADLSSTTTSGVTSVEIDNLGGAAQYTLAGSQTLKVSNDNGATVRAVTAIYGATDAAASVVLNGVGKSTGAATVDVQGAALATLNLTSTGAANNITLTNSAGTKLAKVTIAGDKAVTVTDTLAALKTFDATNSTGAVKVDVSGATLTTASAFAFTGGSGNDTLVLKNAVLSSLTSGAQLVGGSGNDILGSLDTSIDANTAKAINAATGFETFGFFAGTAVSADLSTITSLTQFDIATAVAGSGANGAAGTAGATGSNGAAGASAAAVGVAFTGAGNTQSIIFDTNVSTAGGSGGVGGAATGTSAAGSGGAGKNGAIALSVAPFVDNGSNAITIVLNGVTLDSSGGAGGAGGAATTGGTNGAGGAGGNAANTIDASSYESVYIVSNANAAGTTTANALLANLGAAGAAGAGNGGSAAAGAAGTAGAGLVLNNNGTVKISGAADLNTGTISATNVTVDASSLTGKLTTATGSGNDVITGGSGVNLITLNGGFDTVDLSKSTAKADVITISSAGTNQDATIGKITAITGFTSAATTGDKIDLSAIGAAGTVIADFSNQVSATANLLVSSSGGVVTFSGSAAATATFAQELAAVFANLSGGNRVAEFVYGNDTYIVKNVGNDTAYLAGTDEVIKLVGVTGQTGFATTAAAANKTFIVL